MEVPGQPRPSYHSIDLSCLQVGSDLKFGIYLKRGAASHILFLKQGVEFNQDQRQRLVDNKIQTLYISGDDAAAYARYLEQHLGPILKDPWVPAARKAQLLYSVEKALLGDIFGDPTSPDTVERVEQVAEHTVSFLLQGPDVLHHLIRIMSDDYDTFTHSINVCVLSVSLAAHVGITSRSQLDDLATGSLLHDIGKSEVPKPLLRGTGALSPQEMEIVKQHVEFGERILRDDPRMNPERMLAVSQHHERLDGCGYPRGLEQAQIHLYGRVTAVADSFDAMTTERTYQSAMRAFESISILRGRLREQFDQEIVDALIQMLAKSQRAFRRAS